MTTFLEMTVRIDEDSWPQLYRYLSERPQGKQRATALKRIAEIGLVLQNRQPLGTGEPSTNSAPPSQAPYTTGASGDAAIPTSEIKASLNQFLSSDFS